MNPNEHKFWSTQPVRKGEGNDSVEGQKKIPEKPYSLPNGFYFTSLTIEDIDKIDSLLAKEYVEDDEGEFRLKYHKDFLLWQFNNPNHKKDYLLGVKRDDELLGFTFAKENKLMIKGKKVKMVSINYLCVIKQLRNKRLAPLIIKEITRRANINGIYQAIFTGGIKLPFAISNSRYYHRILNYERLKKLGFCNFSAQQIIKHKNNALPLNMRINTRLLEEKDFEQIYKIYNQRVKNFEIYECFTFEEFKYNFANRENVFYTLVHEENNVIIGFVSFYIISNLVLNRNEEIKTAYLYYYSSDDTNLIITDALIFANSIKCDLFNCLDLMNNEIFIKSLNFEAGDGVLNYYFFNWEINEIKNSNLHFILP